ncbi:MAG: phosphatase PAP2 family protein [Actinobacteria bacterium]|nr:phosphatase PAP2 family protein [Actinomycetota bacterium]
MTSYSEAAARRLPRGWGHLALQFAIWLGFYAAYQVARGAADHSVERAFTNGERIIDFQRSLGSMIELPLQHAVEASSFLVQATSYTYWLSQFAVVGIALLWIYFRAHERFLRFRNTLILANLIGLVGYVAFPTAPPRMFPEAGFTDTLARHSTLTHDSSVVQFAANPYAAMPSLHSADALIVGIVMALALRRPWAKVLWLAWPAWVWVSVMGTGNHFWLDIAAGIAVAAVAAALVYRGRLWPPRLAG